MRRLLSRATVGTDFQLRTCLNWHSPTKPRDAVWANLNLNRRPDFFSLRRIKVAMIRTAIKMKSSRIRNAIRLVITISFSFTAGL